MYKFLCIGKCACFLLLVMMLVSVLTCSGFRIDSSNSDVVTSSNKMLTAKQENAAVSLLMYSDDNRRKNSNAQYSTSADSISDNMDDIDPVFQVRSDRTSGGLSERTSFPVNSFEFNSVNSSRQPHRLRHRRSRQNHHQFKSESSPLYQPRSSQSNYHLKESQYHQHSQRLSNQQIPTKKKNHNNKINRNNNKRRKQEKDTERQGNRKISCQQQNVARKAYIANTVVLASVVSMNSERVHNYSVTFRIENSRQHVYKKLYDVDSDIRLTFLNNTNKMNCEVPQRRLHGAGVVTGPVKAQIKQSKKYFLFLNSTGSHDYIVIGMPVPYKERDLAVIKRVTNSSFVPILEAPTIHVLTAGGTPWNTTSPSGDYSHQQQQQQRPLDIKPGQKIRLECNVHGFPIPLITWERNHTRVTANNTRIIYRKKRVTLVIKQARPQDSGVYRCVAHGVDGSRKHAQAPEIRISNSENKNNYGAPCREKYNTTFCQNGGVCREVEVTEPTLPVLLCICPDGFHGERCAEKSVENSMYMQKTSCAENYMC